MGLTTLENAPDGKIVKTDVSIAKKSNRNCLKNDKSVQLVELHGFGFR